MSYEQYVAEVLTWSRSVALRESADLGAVSPLGRALDSLALGISGSGCTGTKGVGKASSGHRRAVAVDSDGERRYRALLGQCRATTDAVVADGQGDRSLPVMIGKRSTTLSLCARVGLRCASPAQQDKWLTRIAAGDGSICTRAAEQLGEILLCQAAIAWKNA